MTWIAGVDGCRSGWIAAFAPLDQIAEPIIRIVPDINAIIDAPEAPSIICVDMPIGLPERIDGPGRTPERLVRPLLGARQSSVFSIPARAAVFAPDYAGACAEAAARSDPPRKVSKQGYMIFPKIREIDMALRARPAMIGRLFESHPEVVFWALNGGRALTEPKKLGGKPWTAGMELRRNLLAAAGIGRLALEAPAPRGAALDDLLDALACLATAAAIGSGRAQSFPPQPVRDAHDIPVAIWTPMAQTSAPQSGIHAMPASPVTHAMIDAAASLIAGQARQTPVLALPRGALGGDWVPVFKLELLQHAGSFKARGAFNNLLSRTVPPSGVAAASGGNHGAAVAYAAMKLGHKARIFVPEISSPAKIDTIRRFGAEIVIGGARYDDAQAACDAYVAASGAMRIHPFSAVETMAGQGTLAREWDQQAPVDSALIAVGGGGLIAGAASWWAGRPTRVIGVEPAGSRALHAALEAGRPVDVPVDSVAADSLGARNVGQLVFDVCKPHVDQVVLVPDEAITLAQKTLWQDFRIASEPGGAAAFAAILCGAYTPAPGERVGILLCGGNVDLAKLAGIAA
ncbi:MAG: serine/threonine dehydratase [Beijerinckiaceae bacterium]|jgi:threonine dehydratase/predicted RNase H-like nuclease|nr:serine/threonine dehydratase [Beijerinckiaceae bacterium]